MENGSVSAVLKNFSGGRDDLIPILQDVQNTEGYLSEDSIRLISRKLKISENYIFGVATFYAQFRFHPPGEHSIHICLGTACHVKGGEQISSYIEHRLGISKGETTSDGKFELNHVACLGCCALAPVVKIDDTIHSQMSVLKIRKVMDEHYESE
ncbi:MAG TPA: NADH-quinone oxidoreductase subunit NuoE [Firmicutes bacterium]|nr:NADH-quinone oxidoreductase subunit NuoE [Bacillota bacterium]